MRVKAASVCYAEQEWESNLGRHSVDKAAMNRLVVEHLMVQGHAEALKCFLQETGLGSFGLENGNGSKNGNGSTNGDSDMHTTSAIDLARVRARMEVRTAIIRGEIPKGVGLINDLDPEILEVETDLYFRLCMQQLVELIRGGDARGALLFARDELAAHAGENPDYLKEIEVAMMFLLYKDAKSAPPEVGYLLDASRRAALADRVNKIVLLREGSGGESELHRLLKMIEWSEGQLADAGVTFPTLDTTEEGYPLRAPAPKLAD